MDVCVGEDGCTCMCGCAYECVCGHVRWRTKGVVRGELMRASMAVRMTRPVCVRVSRCVPNTHICKDGRLHCIVQMLALGAGWAQHHQHSRA